MKTTAASRRKKLRSEGLSRLCSQFVTQRSIDGVISVLDAMRDEEIGPEWLLRSLNNGWSPLNYACWDGFADAAILMLDRGVSTLPHWWAQDDSHLGASALGLAVGAKAQSADGLRLVRELISRGVDIEATGDQGGRPLCIAAGAGSATALEVLLAAGADVGAVDHDGCSALYRSIHSAGQGAECMLLLLEAGADPHAKAGRHLSAIECMERNSSYASPGVKDRLRILRSWMEQRSIQESAAPAPALRRSSRI